MQVRTLVQALGYSILSPVVSPDGKTIAVSVFFSGGYRDIVLFDFETGAKANDYL